MSQKTNKVYPSTPLVMKVQAIKIINLQKTR